MSLGWQNKDTDGSTGGWGLLSFSFFLALSLTTYLPIFLLICPSIHRSIHLSIYRSIYLSFYLHTGAHFLGIWSSKKVVREGGALCILTWKCASRLAADCFRIWSSKSGPNFHGFSLLTWKRASRHNGVQCVQFVDIGSSKKYPKVRTWWFFALWRQNWRQKALRATVARNLSFFHLAAALASLFFDPPVWQSIEKTQCFATFLTFRTPVFSFLWLFLSLSSALLF